MYYTAKKRIIQGITAALSIVAVIVCSVSTGTPRAEAVELDHPQALGYQVLRAIAREQLQERLDNERRMALQSVKLEKLASMKAESETERQNGGNSVALTEPEQWWTDEEEELMACAIYCEAGSDSIPDDTRLMVGQVILNRVHDPRYPNSIKDVLTQRSQYGRFYWTGVVWPSRAANEPEAVARSYDCAERVLGGEWPLPEDVVYQAEFRQGRECVAEADGMYFCR